MKRKLRKHKPRAGRRRKNPAFDDKALQKLMAPQLADAMCAVEVANALRILPREQRFPAATLFRWFMECLADANKRRADREDE